MQIWLFFQAGTGGDGIANLFERSSNIESIDQVNDHWRIHRIVNGKIKFYAPTIDMLECFRNCQFFDQEHNRLTDEYINIIHQNLNCVVTSHDVTLDALFASHCQDILMKNQIKVLLTSSNRTATLENAITKNLLPKMLPAPKLSVFPEKFDYVLDADLIKTDWTYVSNFCKAVNLELSQHEYIQYQDLLAGNKTFMAKNFGIEEWISVSDGTHITYELINTWQPGKVDQ
jgi:hypothetical protein